MDREPLTKPRRGQDEVAIPPPTTADRSVVTALGDPTSLDLLLALRGSERDAHGLVIATGLAQSSIYRKLRELQAAGLVYVPRLVFSQDGRKIEMFRARWRVIRVELNDGRLRVERSPWDDAAGRLDELWEDVRTFGR